MAHTRTVKSDWGDISRPSKWDEKGFVGREGGRDIFFLKYKSFRHTRKGFTVYTFEDENCNNFILFGNEVTNESGDTLDEDTCYIIKATVKRHQTNDWGTAPTLDTVINRPKFLKTIGKKEKPADAY